MHMVCWDAFSVGHASGHHSVECWSLSMIMSIRVKLPLASASECSRSASNALQMRRNDRGGCNSAYGMSVPQTSKPCTAEACKSSSSCQKERLTVATLSCNAVIFRSDLEIDSFAVHLSVRYAAVCSTESMLSIATESALPAIRDRSTRVPKHACSKFWTFWRCVAPCLTIVSTSCCRMTG